MKIIIIKNKRTKFCFLTKICSLIALNKLKIIFSKNKILKCSTNKTLYLKWIQIPYLKIKTIALKSKNNYTQDY